MRIKNFSYSYILLECLGGKISLNTILGNLAIKGEGLKMNKLDVQNGDVIIIGYISSMIYSGKDGKKSKESIIKKIFK
ncbi:MAG: YabP/YqfC family sporulation protein [Clostridium sp.]|nr:YabP/YqfC family sporulation protein [Clostridium sp.]